MEIGLLVVCPQESPQLSVHSLWSFECRFNLLASFLLQGKDISLGLYTSAARLPYITLKGAN